MSRVIITMSRMMFFRLLAHAPEDLQREAKETDAAQSMLTLHLDAPMCQLSRAGKNPMRSARADYRRLRKRGGTVICSGEQKIWTRSFLILEGDAGAEPAFPVLWAVPEGKAEAPWGKIVELD